MASVLDFSSNMHHTLHALYPAWTLGLFFVLYSMLFIGATASLINSYRKSREQSWVYVFKNPTVQSCIYWCLMLSSAGNDHKILFLTTAVRISFFVFVSKYRIIGQHMSIIVAYMKFPSLLHEFAFTLLIFLW